MGEHADAAQQASDVAKEANQAGALALAMNALAVASRAHLAAGDIELATELAQQAHAIRESVEEGVEEDEAEVFLALAEALEASGRHQEASAVRQEGRERTRALAMRIADETWQQRFLSEVPDHRRLLQDAESDPHG